jgi:hypothetical protein
VATFPSEGMKMVTEASPVSFQDRALSVADRSRNFLGNPSIFGEYVFSLLC